MFQGWDSFHLMIGAASASLIGLLFVVVTLTQGRDRSSSLRGVSIYMTPSVLHFAIALVRHLPLAPPYGGFAATADDPPETS